MQIKSISVIFLSIMLLLSGVNPGASIVIVDNIDLKEYHEIALSPDNALISVIYANGTLLLINSSSGSIEKHFQIAWETVTHKWLSDNQIVLAGAKMVVLNIFDNQNSLEFNTTGFNIINTMKFSKNKSILFTGTRYSKSDGYSEFTSWNVSNGEIIKNYKISDQISEIQLNPTETRALCLTYYKILIFNLQTNSLENKISIDTSTNEVKATNWVETTNEIFIALQNLDGTNRLQILNGSNLNDNKSIEMNDIIYELSVSPDNNYIACAMDNTIQIISLETLNTNITLRKSYTINNSLVGFIKDKGSFLSLNWASDQSFIVAGSIDTTIRKYNLTSESEELRIGQYRDFNIIDGEKTSKSASINVFYFLVLPGLVIAFKRKRKSIYLK